MGVALDVATDDRLVEIAGLVNPGGVVHHIGCYVAAPGAIQIGDPQTAFSWFPGWSWQIVLCGRCRAHLGWIYRCSPDQFHGLIRAALRGHSRSRL